MTRAAIGGITASERFSGVESCHETVSSGAGEGDRALADDCLEEGCSAIKARPGSSLVRCFPRKDAEAIPG